MKDRRSSRWGQRVEVSLVGVPCKPRDKDQMSSKERERNRQTDRDRESVYACVWKDQGKGLSPADLNLKTRNIFSRVQSRVRVSLVPMESSSLTVRLSSPTFSSFLHPFLGLFYLFAAFFEIKACRRRQFGPWGVMREGGWGIQWMEGGRERKRESSWYRIIVNILEQSRWGCFRESRLHRLI